MQQEQLLEVPPVRQKTGRIFSDLSAVTLLRFKMDGDADTPSVTMNLSAIVGDYEDLAGLPDPFAAQYAVMASDGGPSKAEFSHEMTEREIVFYPWSPEPGKTEPMLTVRPADLSKFRMEGEDGEVRILFAVTVGTDCKKVGHWAVEHRGETMYWKLGKASGELFEVTEATVEPISTGAPDVIDAVMIAPAGESHIVTRLNHEPLPPLPIDTSAAWEILTTLAIEGGEAPEVHQIALAAFKNIGGIDAVRNTQRGPYLKARKAAMAELFEAFGGECRRLSEVVCPA